VNELEKIGWFFVQRDIKKIIHKLGSEKEVIRVTPKKELIRFHRSLGLFLRNSFRRNRFIILRSYCSSVVTKSGEPMSFDALSSVAIEEIWKALQEAK